MAQLRIHLFLFALFILFNSPLHLELVLKLYLVSDLPCERSLEFQSVLHCKFFIGAQIGSVSLELLV